MVLNGQDPSMEPIDSAKALAAVAEPMQHYRERMKGDLSDWMPLEHAAQMLLDGKAVADDAFVPEFRPIINMMRVITEKAASGGWNWADPEVQKTFAEVAGGSVYGMYADILVETVLAILNAVPVNTVIEVGSGSGFVTRKLCQCLTDQGLDHIVLGMSDQLPAITNLANELRRKFPRLSILDSVWNITGEAPDLFKGNLKKPVLLFERFSLPYAGYGAIDNLAPLADILFLVDDLSLTGEKASFDRIYEKIGTQFLVFAEALKHLEKYFATVHSCDAAIARAIHSPVTTFTLALP